MSAQVSIVIPAFNQLDYCRQCVTTLLANTAPPYSLILVDNGSTDGVGEFFDGIAGATVIHTGENLGFAGGINRGLAHARGHVLLLNSDTLLPRGWLDRLRAALDADPGVGLVGPRSNCVSGPQQIDGLEFGDLDAVETYADALWSQHGAALREATRLVGFCLLIRDTAFAAIGALDERFGIGNFEDDDYGLRAMRAGYRLAIAEGCFVFHYGSRTFAGMGLTGDAWQALIARNEAVFREKWRGPAPAKTGAAEESRRHNRAARRAAESGDREAALRLLAQAIAADPGQAENYNDLGAVLWAMGERARACEQFERALRIEPEHAAARANLRDAQGAPGRAAEEPR